MRGRIRSKPVFTGVAGTSAFGLSSICPKMTSIVSRVLKSKLVYTCEFFDISLLDISIKHSRTEPR